MATGAQRLLFDDVGAGHARPLDTTALLAELEQFNEFGAATRVDTVPRVDDRPGVPSFTNEFWTSKQRAASSMHEISYRACFKPQLPRFFIERLTTPGDVVYDPFMGRGTTPVEAALLGRVPFGCDVNPLSARLVAPRLTPPTAEAVADRLAAVDWHNPGPLDETLLVFYHPETLREIQALRRWLLRRDADGTADAVDGWIRMVAVNRLTGHSPGFFSVYTLPPNQAVSAEAQRKINQRRGQQPLRRLVPDLIVRKTKSLLSRLDPAAQARLAAVAPNARLVTASCAATPQLADASVQLAVTSPPFLDVVQYAQDNWLRCWFCGIDPKEVPISMHRQLPDWQASMTQVFAELHRVLVPGGWIAFEVGEVRGGSIRLDEATLPCGVAAGLEPVLILINEQHFTKTANCWGIDNNRKGTNTNRVVVLRRPC
ncbi:MAG: DNA methyltransferase [Planctomycetota bacterium]